MPRRRLLTGALTILALVAALSLTLSGCGPDEEAVPVDLSRREEPVPAAPKRGLTYAYLPQYAHAVSYRRHRLLVEYLSKAVGMPIRQVFPDTFDEHVKMVARGEIDISFSNPFVYLRLADSGARAFARIIEPSGKPDFRGQIISRKDDPSIATLDDCRGKRWMAVDPTSAGGYLFALGEFHDHGIRRDDFAEVGFAPGPGGKQEKTVLAVYSGTWDVGSIREGTLAVLADRIDLDRIRVLAETRAYPSWVYASRPGLDPEIVRKVAEAMFHLSISRPDDAVILQTANIRGIIPAADADYDSVRELVKKLGLSPENVQ